MVTIPHQNDVLFGRGKGIDGHPGNQRFRALVEVKKQKYLMAKGNNEKRAIAMDILNEVNSLQPPGRFLVEDINLSNSLLKTKTWVPAGFDKALEKILHRLREKKKEISEADQIHLKEESCMKRKPYPSGDNPETTSRHIDSETNQLSIGERTGKEAGWPPQHQQSGEKLELHPFKTTTSLLRQSLQPDAGAIINHQNVNESLPVSGESARYVGLEIGSESFTHDFSSQRDDCAQLQELTFHQWVSRSKSQCNVNTTNLGHSYEGVRKYAKSALPIALRLADCLREAEKDEQNGHQNAIPIASIAAENVLLRLKEPPSSEGDVQEVIEYAWFISCLDELNNPHTGAVTSRLFALGVVLYDLFSADDFPLDEDISTFDASSNLPSMNAINLHNDDDNRRPPNKSQKLSLHHSEAKISNFISRLESRGIPWSLCALVKNLLDCSKGELSGDEAYSSFADLQLDLGLMMDDPSRFLDNIQTDPMPGLELSDKLYGRKDEMLRLEQAYQLHINGGCNGVIISGGAGVGKSKLAMHVLKKSKNQLNGYLLAAKFDQNRDVKPFTIGNMFNLLCELFVQDSTPNQMTSVSKELESALGSQASLLAGIVPGLSKLLPSCARSENSSICVDTALSMRFLISSLLRVISSHSSKPITLFLDDIQWADAASLLLVGNLIHSVEGCSKSAFFTFCYRDDEVSRSGPFDAWLSSLSMFRLETIKLNNITDGAVNQLVSDALHLSPRITRPLSSVLHHKTRGNPLFLKQLMESLKEQSYIYLNLNPPRWAWDLEKITELKISDDVAVLLMNEMQRLDDDLQLGLKVASCIGNQVKYRVLEILSNFLEKDLVDILQQVTTRGFMNKVAGVTFSFAHDKIQLAAYELMTKQQRCENHMQYGLALCAHAYGLTFTHPMNESTKDEELFLAAANQINRGGPNAIRDPNQKSTVAALNLKVGKLTIDRSGYSAAFQLFEHGISFLGSNLWTDQYRLSVDLFDAAADAACALNKNAEVALYSDRLVANANCFDDKLNCLCAAAKALRQSYRLKESMESSFAIIQQLGEELPRPIGDSKLNNDIRVMNGIILNTPDDSILNMKEASNKKIVTLMKIYSNLADLLHFAKPSLLGAVSLKMIDLTLEIGLCPTSPLAFCYYGEMLAATGNLAEGCRLGRLALKLCEKKNSSRYKSCLICLVHQTILWASEPMQSICNAHLFGRKAGQQSGDFFFSSGNLIAAITTSYVAGQSLYSVRESIRDSIWEMQSQNLEALIGNSILLHSQIIVLQEGLHILDSDRVDNIPTERELLAGTRFAKDKVLVLCNKVHHLMRVFFFRQLDGMSLDTISIWGEISKQENLLFPMMGVFYEGLVSFHLARQTKERMKWIQNGDAILSKIECLSSHSSWNWENKKLLLNAEKMYTLGNFDEAVSLYEGAIRSSHGRKFIHEEAIASELAGIFHCKRGPHQKAYDLLMHAAQCYENWGALAVAKRVQSLIEIKCASTFIGLEPGLTTLTCILSESVADSSKKRQDRE